MILGDAWKLDSAAPEALEVADLVVTVRRALLTLTEREERAVRLRYFEGATLAKVGDALDVGKERASQIIDKALRKLKHPSRSRKLRSALDGDLPFRSYLYAEPETPSEAQEMARRLRELQSHIEDTKRRKTQQEEWLANYRAKSATQRQDWWDARVYTPPARQHPTIDKFYADAWMKQHPTMGEGRCIIRIVRTVAATTEGEMIIMHPGETWLVDEEHRDDLVALGYAVIA